MGLRLQVHEGGSSLCGSQCEKHHSLLCSFHPASDQLKAGRAVGPECTVRGRDGGRADEEADECESEMVEGDC